MRELKGILGKRISPLLENPKISDLIQNQVFQKSSDDVIKDAQMSSFEKLRRFSLNDNFPQPNIETTDTISKSLKDLDAKIIESVSILSKNQEELESNYQSLKKEISKTNKRLDDVNFLQKSMQKQIDTMKYHLYGQENVDKFDPQGKYRRFKETLQESLSYRAGQAVVGTAYKGAKGLAGSLYSVGKNAATGIVESATIRAAAPYAGVAAAGATALGVAGYGLYKGYQYFFGDDKKKEDENKKVLEELKNNKSSVNIETQELIISAKTQIHLKAEKEILLKSKKITLEADEVIINSRGQPYGKMGQTSDQPALPGQQQGFQQKTPYGINLQKEQNFGGFYPGLSTPSPYGNQNFSGYGSSSGEDSQSSGSSSSYSRTALDSKTYIPEGSSSSYESLKSNRTTLSGDISDKALEKAGIFPGTNRGTSFDSNYERQTGPITADSKGNVNPQQYYDAMVEKFRNSKLNGYIPKDGDRWGIKTGSPEEWARFATMLTKGESGTRDGKAFSIYAKGPNGEPSYGISQMKPGEYGLKTMDDVLDPEKASSAMIKQFEKYIIGSEHVGGRGTGPGTYDGWRGAAAYFGPIRTDWQQKQSNWFDKNIKVGETKEPGSQPLINLERVPTQAEIDNSLAKGNKTFHFDPTNEGADKALEYIKSKGGQATAYWQGGGSKEFREKEIDLTSEEGIKAIKEKAAEMSKKGYSAMQVDNLHRLKSVEDMKAVFDAVSEGSGGKIQIVPNGNHSLVADLIKKDSSYKDRIAYGLGENIAKGSKEDKEKAGQITKAGIPFYDIEFSKGQNATDLDSAKKFARSGNVSGVYWYNHGEGENGKGGVSGNQDMIYSQGVSTGSRYKESTDKSAVIVDPRSSASIYGMSSTIEKEIPKSGENRSEGRERFSIASHVHTYGLDSRLIDIGREASKYLPEGYRVELTSGHRPGDKRFHGRGMASDFTIYDDTGKKLGNYQDRKTFRIYEKFAQDAKKIQSDKYPILNDKFSWGGYFGGNIKGQPFAKYGAMDLMHLDIGGARGVAGSFEKGLNPEYRSRWGVFDSQGMGSIRDYELKGSGISSGYMKDGNLKDYIKEKYNLLKESSTIDKAIQEKILVAEAPAGTPQFQDPLQQIQRSSIMDAYKGSIQNSLDEKYRRIGLISSGQPEDIDALKKYADAVANKIPEVDAEQLRPKESASNETSSQENTKKEDPPITDGPVTDDSSLKMEAPTHDPESEAPKASSDGYGRQPGTDSIAGGNE